MKKTKLVVGDTIYSKYFKANLKIVKINSDDDWYFELNDTVLKAQTPLSHFEKINTPITNLPK